MGSRKKITGRKFTIVTVTDPKNYARTVYGTRGTLQSDNQSVVTKTILNSLRMPSFFSVTIAVWKRIAQMQNVSTVLT